VVPFVARHRDVEMFYDIRSKKVFAEKQLEGYLRTTVFYFVQNSNTRNFNLCGVQSDVQPGIRAVDFVAWAIQRRHEMGDTRFYDIVAQKIVTELIGPEVFCRRRKSL